MITVAFLHERLMALAASVTNIILGCFTTASLRSAGCNSNGGNSD